MGELADRIEALTVSVTSPDNNIRAVLRNRDRVSIEFRPGSYEKYTESEVAHQISRLATLIYTGRARGYRKLMDEFNVTFKHSPGNAGSLAERRYLEARNDLQVIAKTPRKLVRLKTIGLTSWECRVAEGTLKKLSESEFLQEVRGIAANLIHSYNTKAAILKDEHLGLNIPAGIRARVRADQGR